MHSALVILAIEIIDRVVDAVIDFASHSVAALAKIETQPVALARKHSVQPFEARFA